MTDPRWRVDIWRTTDSAPVKTGGLELTDSVTQRGIVAFVADRGYLDGYDRDQRIARQIAKMTEELAELSCAVTVPLAEDGWLILLQRAGELAKKAFDNPQRWNGVTVDVPTLIAELPDMVVPLAVLADAIGIPDMMEAGLEKARQDVKRGVRNGANVQPPA